jgi:hypothetical protein
VTGSGARSAAWREALRAGERLRELERQLDHRRSEPPAPGDLLVLRETAGHPVEWLVAEIAGPPGAGRVLLAPADTHPLVGSGDVEVPGVASGGRLSVRCRFAAWVPAGVAAAGRRTGAVPAEPLARVRERCRMLAAGEAVGTALEREVDDELEYRDWIDEVVAPARAGVDAAGVAERTAAAARPEADERPPVPAAPERWRSRGLGPDASATRGRSLRQAVGGLLRRRWAEAAAALFLLATIGLSIRVAALRREVATLTQPVAGVAAAEVRFGERTRGPTRVNVASDAPYLVLFLVLGDDLPAYDRYQLRILDWRGDLLFAGEPLEGGLYAEHSLGVPRRLLAEGVLRLELYGLAEGGPVRLEERVVAVGVAGEGGR